MATANLTQAQAALASDTYNPSRTPDVVSLFNLMQGNTVSDALLAQYKQVVNSMTTENAYAGVLFNPRGCEVDQATTDLSEISDTLQANPAATPQQVQAVDTAGDQLAQYKAHTDRLIANFPTISSIVQQEIGNNLSTGSSTVGGTSTTGGNSSDVPAQGSAGTGSSSAGLTSNANPASASGNPCIGFADIMGSILDAGQKVMNQVMDAIANLKTNASADTSAVDDATQQLQAAIAKAMQQQQDEVTKLANSMIKIQKMSLAQLMKYQNQDPCLKQILSSVQTSAAQNITGATS